MSVIMYGGVVADKIKNDLTDKIKQCSRAPHLCVIIVGDNVASQTYVNNKAKACASIGMDSSLIQLPTTITQAELLSVIERCNNDDKIDGLLVQLPLPKHIDTNEVIEAIDPNKDVDGFHPVNVGKASIGLDAFNPCTPSGIMEMLKHYEIEVSGKHAVVVGRSNIVGKPMANLLLKANASVTIVHSKTEDIKELTKQADILIVAAGQQGLVDASWIKPNCVIIDVGMHRNEAGKLCGDVNFEDVEAKVAAISPVPKGVGVMTIAMLLKNTYDAYLKGVL